MFNIFGFYKFKKLNNLKKLKNRLENNLMLEQGYKESEDFLVMEEENNIKLIKDKG